MPGWRETHRNTRGGAEVETEWEDDTETDRHSDGDIATHMEEQRGMKGQRNTHRETERSGERHGKMTARWRHTGKPRDGESKERMREGVTEQ